jgi:Uma2 family endonuclease
MRRREQSARRATYDDLLKVPEHRVAEIVDGELYATPRPAPRHADASSGIGGVLRGPFDRGRGGPGGWRILFEPELHLGDDILVPDIAGWRRERLPAIPDDAYIVVVPDWICEVVSPSTAALDRVKKLAVYARDGVQHAWIVDPLAQTLEVLRLEHGRWTIVGTWEADASVSAEPFESLEWDLTLLWDQPPPSPPR